MSRSSGKYMDWSGSLKQRSLDNTALSRHYLWHFTKIMSSDIHKTGKWNMALRNCTHFNWIQCRSVKHHYIIYIMYYQASSSNLLQITFKLTYIPYANSGLQIRKFSVAITFNAANKPWKFYHDNSLWDAK